MASDQELVRADRVRHRRQAQFRRSHAARSARRAGKADRRGRRQGQRVADACASIAPATHAKALMKKPAGERGLLAGLAGADQGSDRCRGRADHAGLADLQGSRSPRTPTSWSSISKRNGARDLRQVEHAGVRRRRQYLQRSVRRDAQSLGTVAIRRRLLGRRGGRRSPPAWRGSRTAPTWAARCAIPRASAASSACGRASAASRIRLPPRSTAISASRARWRAMSRTWRCCSMP